MESARDKNTEGSEVDTSGKNINPSLRAGPLRFSKMSREDLVQYCRSIYEVEGLEGLSFKSLNSDKALYSSLYKNGLTQKVLLESLELSEAYKAYKNSSPYQYGGAMRNRITWERIVERARIATGENGHLPAALAFAKRGDASLVQAVYALGRTWDQLREAVGDFESSLFVQSRNGMRWLSHAEASLSNYLYARGIVHKKGTRYPQSFAAASQSRYAIFDMHFVAQNGEFFDVEVWGDRPNGHNEEGYKKVRQFKEAFNSSNPRFLGIHHADCYSDQRLTEILSPFVGTITPYRFDKPTDSLIQTAHWSNTDELLQTCRMVALSMPDGIFPTEEWLRKRGKWAARPGDAYNTLAVYIKTWIGGVRKLRELLEQGHASTKQWDRASTIAAYKAFYELHGMTPQQVRHLGRRGDPRIERTLAKQATNLCSAAQKYADGASAVHTLLGITVERELKWTREAVTDAHQWAIDRWRLSPSQVLGDAAAGLLSLTDDERRKLERMIPAAKPFGGTNAVLAALSFKKPKRKQARNRRDATGCVAERS